MKDKSTIHLQLHINTSTCPTYSEKFIRDTVFAPFYNFQLPLSKLWSVLLLDELGNCLERSLRGGEESVSRRANKKLSCSPSQDETRRRCCIRSEKTMLYWNCFVSVSFQFHFNCAGSFSYIMRNSIMATCCNSNLLSLFNMTHIKQQISWENVIFCQHNCNTKAM